MAHSYHRVRGFRASWAPKVPAPFAAVAAVVIAVVAGTAAPAAAVAHGEPVKAGRYAFAARLTMTGIPTPDGGRRDSWCSGALVAPRWVITAAHCFRDENGRRVDRPVADRTVVTVGRADLTGDAGQEATVVAVRPNGSADVALVELDRDITGIRPIPISRAAPVAGETLRLAGYGLTGSDTDAAADGPDRLQTGRFAVDATGDGVIDVSGRHPEPDTSACPHDSGGPYFREPKGGEPELVAVVSTGPPCPHTGPDRAARVDPLVGWVDDTVTGSGTGFPTAALAVVPALGVLVLWWVRRQVRGRRAR